MCENDEDALHVHHWEIYCGKVKPCTASQILTCTEPSPEWQELAAREVLYLQTCPNLLSFTL